MADPTTPTPEAAATAPAPAQPATEAPAEHRPIWEPDPEDTPEAAPAPVDSTPAAAPPVEPAQAQPAPPEAPKAAKALALIARREAEQRKRDEALKAKEAELATREQQLKDPDVMKRLEAVGLTYEQLTDHILTGKKVEGATAEQVATLKKLEERIQKQEAEAAERQQAEKKRAEQQAERALSTIKSQLNDYVAANTDKYEYITALGEQDTVFALIDEYGAKHREWLGGSPEEAYRIASEQVEAYLAEKTERLLTTKKFQTKLSPSQGVATQRAVPATQRPPANSAQPAQSPTKPKTLTQTQAAQVPPRGPVHFTSLEDSIAAHQKSGRRIWEEDD